MSNELQRIGEIDFFKKCMEKISVNPKSLTEEEQYQILTVAALLMKKYSLDRRYTSYVELAYFIILNYSIAFDDYRPLYDFSIAFGLYPISDTITKNGLISFDTISNALLEQRIKEEYSYNNIIETFEQKKLREHALSSKDEHNQKSYVAPTSFGKSHLILSHIQKYFEKGKKYAIIVPTKALLMQTYKNVKQLNIDTKILTHDEMYQEDNTDFIGVLTQERAFRLINNEKHKIYFDFLYIDEAHKLLKKDDRSILLARLIKLNKLRNNNCRILYFSPLLENSSNLLLIENDNIDEKRIKFNLKEPKIFEYKKDNTKHIYNRFINQFFPLKTTATNIFSYIKNEQGRKNFIYLSTPKKIEYFTGEFSLDKEIINDDSKIDGIVYNLKEYVHKDFNMIDYIKKGILYIHAKLPDNIRNYLLDKFSKLSQLNILIANTVILEGVNLPIDTLFVLNTYKLEQKDLVNLIGRVNRLNSIFTNSVDFNKLQPQIHFLNSDEYGGKRSNFSNQITKWLRKTNFIDELQNPLLNNFDKSSIKEQKDIEKIKSIQENEKIFFSEPNTPQKKIEKKLVELGINNIYRELSQVVNILYKKFIYYRNNPQEINNLHIMDKLKFFFIDELTQYIDDYAVKRLENDLAIKYYKVFLKNKKLSLKQKISEQFDYYKSQNIPLYIGTSFGEKSFDEIKNIGTSERYSPKVYIDLSTKTDKEIVNFIILKQCIEDDFVSFKLFMFFQLMLDYRIINLDEYNQVVYGSNDTKFIQLVKLGLPINIVHKLMTDKQIDNIYTDKNGNIQCKNEFHQYKEKLDDLIKFEIDRVIISSTQK